MYFHLRNLQKLDLEGLVLSCKTGQLSVLVSSFFSKLTNCDLQRFHNKTDSLLVEQALLTVAAKPVRPANPCVQ